jgi:RNA polymerase sigma-70 factor, ECF subfamily
VENAQPERRSVKPEVQQTIRRLWSESHAARYEMDYEQLELLLFDIASSHQWGLRNAGLPTAQKQIAFLVSLKVEDLVLARACAAGNEKAWESFLADYRELLYRAAYAIAKQDALGRELADSLYAELFGTTTRDGVRQSKLASYTGRGSLAGWLRSVLSQRFIDDYRKARRTVSLEEQESELLAALPGRDAATALEGVPLRKISESIGRVLKSMKAEESLFLQSYYLDQRSMAEIARLFGVHESTISRKLNQVTKELKKRVLKQLQSDGFSRRAAEEVFSTDVRDLDLDVRKFLQAARETPFQKIEPAVEEKR